MAGERGSAYRVVNMAVAPKNGTQNGTLVNRTED